MSIEISRASITPQTVDQKRFIQTTSSPSATNETTLPQPTINVKNGKVEVESALKDFESILNVFNKRLRFSVNKELEQVVVEVIDKQTDKVVREIPSKEIQDLHVRIKEAIGLLFDIQI